FRPGLESILHAEDMVMGFGPPEGDDEIQAALSFAHSRQAMTFALPGSTGSFAIQPATDDPFIHQETIEILYHTLWETVHVFFEHQEIASDAGDAGFLYPFLGAPTHGSDRPTAEVAASMQLKVQDDTALRARLAREQSSAPPA